MSRVSFDLPTAVERRPLLDLSRKIKGDSARRVHPGMHNDHLATVVRKDHVYLGIFS